MICDHLFANAAKGECALIHAKGSSVGAFPHGGENVDPYPWLLAYL